MLMQGFTATRSVTPAICEQHIRPIIEQLPSGICVITGGAIGGDAFIAKVAYERGDIRIITILPFDAIGSPQTDPLWKKYCHAYTIMPKPVVYKERYKERNQEIVRWSEQLFGFPLYPENCDPRSGTWQTLRMGRRANIPVDFRCVGV